MLAALDVVLLALLSAPADEKVAMVLAVEGTATLQTRDEAVRPVKVMDMLVAGDRLTTAANASVTLSVKSDNHRERVKPSVTVTVTADGCIPAKAVERLKPVAVTVSYPDVHRFTGTGRSTGRVLNSVAFQRAPDPPATPPVVTPMFGAVVLTTRPMLSWQAAPQAAEYQVRLSQEQLHTKEHKEKILWTARTKEPRLPYPAKERPLERGGNYSWSVVVQPGQKDEVIAWRSQFAVATDPAAAELAKLKPLAGSADPADMLRAALAYQEFGVYDKALALFERLAIQTPQEAIIQAALAEYYKRAGRTEESRKALERAKKLSPDLSVLLAAPADEKVAMVLAVQGRVTCQIGDEPSRRVKVMEMLPADAKLTAAADASVTLIFLSDNHRERLKPRVRVSVTAEGCSPAKAVERLNAVAPIATYRNVYSFTAGTRVVLHATVVFGERDRELPTTPPVVTPMFGAVVLTSRPLLSWQPAADVSEYQVRMARGRLDTSASTEKVLWTARTKEPRLLYPEQETPLQFGSTYHWSVVARPAQKDKAAVWQSQFAVASAEVAAKLAKLKPLAGSADPADLLLAALAYQRHGVYEEALALYERLAKRAPHEVVFQKALADYYDRAGRVEESEKALERARTLSTNDSPR